MIIKQTRNTLSDTYLDAVRIRQQVFVKEQGVPRNLEIDEYEAHCLHFVLYDDNDVPCATCRLLPNSAMTTVTLQRMAVATNHRGQGFGKILLEYVLNYAKAQGCQTMELHAQLPACAFYDTLGFTAYGAVFEEAGIEHISMKKTLAL